MTTEKELKDQLTATPPTSFYLNMDDVDEVTKWLLDVSTGDFIIHDDLYYYLANIPRANDENYSTGIGYYQDQQTKPVYKFLAGAMTRWHKYSGNIAFPVPDPAGRLSPYDIWNEPFRSCMNGEDDYGMLFRDLAAFLAAELDAYVVFNQMEQ